VLGRLGFRLQALNGRGERGAAVLEGRLPRQLLVVGRLLHQTRGQRGERGAALVHQRVARHARVGRRLLGHDVGLGRHLAQVLRRRGERRAALLHRRADRVDHGQARRCAGSVSAAAAGGNGGAVQARGPRVAAAAQWRYGDDAGPAPRGARRDGGRVSDGRRAGADRGAGGGRRESSAVCVDGGAPRGARRVVTAPARGGDQCQAGGRRGCRQPLLPVGPRDGRALRRALRAGRAPGAREAAVDERLCPEVKCAACV